MLLITKFINIFLQKVLQLIMEKRQLCEEDRLAIEKQKEKNEIRRKKHIEHTNKKYHERQKEAKKNWPQDYAGNGRFSLYKKEFCQMLIEYADKPPTYMRKTKKWDFREGKLVEYEVEEAVPLPTLAGFARLIGTSKQNLSNWEQAHPEFKEAMEYFREIQEDIMVENGMAGRYDNKVYALVANSILRWRTADINHSIGFVKKLTQEDIDQMTEEQLRDEIDKRISR